MKKIKNSLLAIAIVAGTAGVFAFRAPHTNSTLVGLDGTYTVNANGSITINDPIVGSLSDFSCVTSTKICEINTTASVTEGTPVTIPSSQWSVAQNDATLTQN